MEIEYHNNNFLSRYFWFRFSRSSLRCSLWLKTIWEFHSEPNKFERGNLYLIKFQFSQTCLFKLAAFFFKMRWALFFVEHREFMNKSLNQFSYFTYLNWTSFCGYYFNENNSDFDQFNCNVFFKFEFLTNFLDLNI